MCIKKNVVGQHADGFYTLDYTRIRVPFNQRNSRPSTTKTHANVVHQFRLYDENWTLMCVNLGTDFAQGICRKSRKATDISGLTSDESLG